MSADEKLSQLGYALSEPNVAAANYLPVVRTGNMLYVSGQISIGEDGIIKGALGRDMDVAAGQKAAAFSAVSILSHIVHSAGVPLDNISKFVKLTVLVASTPGFTDQHLVANGASDLLVSVLGDKGKHARAAFGVAALPLGAAVEIEAVVELAS